MESAEYKNIYRNENSHFFYIANHEIFISMVKNSIRSLCSNRNIKILDAGCGTGLLGKKLQLYGDVVGVDISKDALYFSKKRGVKVKKGSINHLPFKDKTFDILVSVDVLYHKKVNDKKALKEFFRVLKPGGYLLLRVPAHSWLLNMHDKYVHTRERYSKRDIKDKIINSGFVIKKLSYVNAILFPLAMFRVILEKIHTPVYGSGVSSLPSLLNTILLNCLRGEKYLLEAFSLPFGVGIIAICTKPKEK